MAETDSGQEKTEQATPKRREDARKKGDIPRSKELTMTGVLLASAGGLVTIGGGLGADLAATFSAGLKIERASMFHPDAMASALALQATAALGVLLPFISIIVVAAIAFSVVLGGVSFSFSSLAPKAERINVAKGLKRMFGLKGLVELIKSVAKVALIMCIALLWFKSIRDQVLGLSSMPVSSAIFLACKLCAMTLLVVSSALILVAALDVPYQLYEYSKKLKMTRQEVRDEHKETEGKPEVRQRIRQMQQDVATRGMMEAVPYADVIITNPTHFAVALKYQEGKMDAPEVVAKGQDNIAARIREIAAENNVALFSAPPLARSLFHSTKIGERIPAGLYSAVAQVLAYIYQLRDNGPLGAKLSPPVPQVDETQFVPRNRRAAYANKELLNDE